MRSLHSPSWVAVLCVAALACERQVIVKPNDLTGDAAARKAVTARLRR